MTTHQPAPTVTRPAAMLSYDETMAVGAARYRDALTALEAAGLPAQFTQTGGMNAALLAYLDGGRVLLVTDAEDALPWDRADQQGWSVGLYRDETLDGAPEQFDTCDDAGAGALVMLAHRVLARFVRSRARVQGLGPAPDAAEEVDR